MSHLQSTTSSKITKSPNQQHHGNQCYNIVVDFIGIILAVAEIGLVIYLSISHFNHSQGVIALAMLGPIFLNFVGVTYFLSNAEERKVFEAEGASRCAKDVFQAPVLGPVFTAIKVFSISSGISKSGDYERFETLAIKMRQAESFFGAAPEALIQLTVLLVAEEPVLTLDQYLEIVIVILSIITLSEANMYAFASNYYRLFHKYDIHDWKLPHYEFWQKCILFLHAFFSIGSRISAMACLKAAVKYFVLTDNMIQRGATDATTNMIRTTTAATSTTSASTSVGPMSPSSQANALGYYLAVFFLVEIGFRMFIYYIIRLIKFTIIGKGIPSGCYEAINYGWRSTILDLGYQSKNIAVQVWFYTENAICFIIWWISVSFIAIQRQEVQRIKNSVLAPLAATFVISTLLSVFMLFACTGLKLHTLRGPFKNV